MKNYILSRDFRGFSLQILIHLGFTEILKLKAIFFLNTHIYIKFQYAFGEVMWYLLLGHKILKALNT